MSDPRRAKLEALLADKPKLHYWPNYGGWHEGGFKDSHLREFFKLVTQECAAEGGVETLETGAGLSTLAFLCAEPRRHICIAPDGELRARLMEQVTRLGLRESVLQFVEERSENALPRIADRDEPFLDLGLIDGLHGYPAPFVDFCYINKVLKRGGYLLVDDTQLHPPRELAMTLRNQPGWQEVAKLEKLVVFRKQTDERFLPGHGAQPYVVANSMRV